MNDSTVGPYEHSGRVGAAVIVVPVGGLVAAAVLSYLYGYVGVYSPFGGYASIIIFVAGFACGLVALYMSWVVFEYALLNRDTDDFTATLPELLLAPGTVWEIAVAIGSDGWYSIFGFTPSGVLLWSFWSVDPSSLNEIKKLAHTTEARGES